MEAGRAQSYSARYLTHGLASDMWQPSQYSTSINSDRSQRHSPYHTMVNWMMATE